MILITGASGFIGAVLCSKISNKRVVLRKNNQQTQDSVFYVDSINEYTNWDGAFDNIDCIVHLASIAHNNAVKTEYLHSVNVLGTKALAQQAIAAGVNKFIYISSIGVNGFKTFDGEVFARASNPKPHNDYAKSKYDAEKELIKLFKDTNASLHIVRPPLVYGKGAPGNFKLLMKLVRYMPILPFGSASNSRSFISVQNLVDFIVYLTKFDTNCAQVFLASEGSPISTKNLTDKLAHSLGKSSWQAPIPKQLFFVLLSLVNKKNVYTQLFEDLVIDDKEVQRVTGWVPPYTMEQALQVQAMGSEL